LLLIDNMEYGGSYWGQDLVAFEALLVEGWGCFFPFVEAASPRWGSTAMRLGVSVFIECGGSHESFNFSSTLLWHLAH